MNNTKEKLILKASILRENIDICEKCMNYDILTFSRKLQEYKDELETVEYFINNVEEYINEQATNNY